MITREDIDRFTENQPKTIPEMVEEFATTMNQESNPETSGRLIEEEFGEWWDIWLQEDTNVEELKEISDLVYVIFGYARVRGWDLMESVRRVHENNMYRCVWPDGSVKYREDGKVLKRPNAKKVDLEDLV